MPSSQIAALFALDDPQSLVQPFPPTIASAATIVPTHKLIFITGTTAIGTITPPIEGFHVLYMVFANASPAVFLTSGNVKTACAPVQNVPVVAMYDPSSAKYWIGRLAT